MPPARQPETKETFFARGRAAVERNARIRPNRRKARNVILFVGDGMGVTTITAARILDGQLRGLFGARRTSSSFEKFPYLAHSKTYQANQQVARLGADHDLDDHRQQGQRRMLSVAPNVLRQRLRRRGASRRTGCDPARAGRGARPVDRRRLDRPADPCDPRRLLRPHARTATPSPTPTSQDQPEAAAAGYPDIARQLLDFQVRRHA